MMIAVTTHQRAPDKDGRSTTNNKEMLKKEISSGEMRGEY